MQAWLCIRLIGIFSNNSLDLETLREFFAKNSAKRLSTNGAQESGIAEHRPQHMRTTSMTIFTFRFFVEFLKKEQVDFEQGMFLDMGQLLNIPLVLVGLWCMIKK